MSMQGVDIGGGGGKGGGSASGSMSTVSREDKMVLSSEDSSYPDESDLELGLGLSLGGGFKAQHGSSRGGQYARILTAKDFPSGVSASCSSSSPSSSSSSSSSSLNRANVTAGTKRTADSIANGSSSQVVGWPPIRAYRMNSMVNHGKAIAAEGFNSILDKNESRNCVLEQNNIGSLKNSGNAKPRGSLFVKVNMDGIPIGRKVDLNSHGCYETLANTLEDMFLRPTTNVNPIGQWVHEHSKMTARHSKLLDASSEFVLTYEDKEGDWMLVGDVPWGMFLSSVKRLRIMRRSEATGLAPTLQKRNERQRNKPI